MRVIPIRTSPVIDSGNILDFLDTHLTPISENTIVVITSKIISILEGSVKEKEGIDKRNLIIDEADLYIDDALWEKFHILLTRKDSVLIACAGIDESNSNNRYILWPKNPFRTAKLIWDHLKQKYSLERVGVIITDSRLVPLRWGTLGIGIAWCGFEPLNNYIGTTDIFGEPLKITQASVIDGISAASVLVMGEGAEQTPLSVVSDIPFVHFRNTPPTDEDIKKLEIAFEDDLYASLLVSDKWKHGSRK